MLVHPGATASGIALKRLVITDYRAGDKAVVERIVQSWLNGVKRYRSH